MVGSNLIWLDLVMTVVQTGMSPLSKAISEQMPERRQAATHRSGRANGLIGRGAGQTRGGGLRCRILAPGVGVLIVCLLVSTSG